MRDTPDLNPEEKELLMILLGDSEFLQYSLVSPCFIDAEQESFSDLLPAAWPILKDAYLAYAGVLKSLHLGCTTEADDASNIRHTASAMAALRSLSITKPDDAKLCLTLGFALALAVYAAIGVGVSEICHYCLSVTRPFTGIAIVDPEIEPRISLLVLLETMECIFFRRKPTLKFHSRTPKSVDRYLGLCRPLLPYFYDLCVINYSLRDSADARHVVLLQQQLEEIQAHVIKWQPSHPDGFIHHFSTVEVVQLLAQARVYRLAALLMIHRLRHKFGQEDSQANIWSCEVMMELDLAHGVSHQPVRFVTLPFIVAAVEVRDPAERIKVVSNVDLYVDQFTPVVQKATKSFLWKVWQERDAGTNCTWFDSVHKPCVVLDSIEASLSDSCIRTIEANA